MSEKQRTRYLEAAYDLVDGSPQQTFAVREVQSKVGLPDDAERDVRQQLADRGLLRDEGRETFRLAVPAIHQVEQTRMDQGRQAEVDERREERGDYVRTLYDLADEDPDESVNLDEIREEMGVGTDVERRTREYLLAAGLIDQPSDNAVTLTKQGAEWVQGA